MSEPNYPYVYFKQLRTFCQFLVKNYMNKLGQYYFIRSLLFKSIIFPFCHKKERESLLPFMFIPFFQSQIVPVAIPVLLDNSSRAICNSSACSKKLCVPMNTEFFRYHHITRCLTPLAIRIYLNSRRFLKLLISLNGSNIRPLTD